MYTLDTDLTQLPNYTPDEIDAFVASRGASEKMQGKGAAFVQFGNQYGVNPIFLMALCGLESGWGKSSFALDRNNLVGYKAFDRNPALAAHYPSPEACIQFIAHYLSNVYLRAPETAVVKLLDGTAAHIGEWWGGSPTPHGIFVHYSSSHDVEANSIAAIMREFVDFTVRTLNVGSPDLPAAQPIPASPPTVGEMHYTVVSGDNLSRICAKFYGDPFKWTLVAAANNLPDANLIQPGQVLRLPGLTAIVDVPAAPPQVNVVQERTYVVRTGDNLWSIAQKVYGDGRQNGRIFEANRDKISDPNLIQPGWTLRIP